MVVSNLAAKPAAPSIRTRSLAGPFESFQIGMKAGEPPQPKIEVQGMSPHEVADVRQKPLIRPMAADSADAQEVWGLASGKADTSPFSGEGVVVAVLDTGIDKTDAAFAGMADGIVQKDFTGTGDDDGEGHGTHCAGTIFGRAVDAKRKVLGDGGDGNSDMVFKGIQWALDQGAHVISISVSIFPEACVAWRTRAGRSSSPLRLRSKRANPRMFDAVQMIRGRAAFGQEPVVAASGNESKTDVDPDFKIAASLPSYPWARCNAPAARWLGFRTFSRRSAVPGVGTLSARLGRPAGAQRDEQSSSACRGCAT